MNGRVIEMRRVSKTLILCLILAICLGVIFNEYLRLSRNVSMVLWQNYLSLSSSMEHSVKFVLRDTENVESMTDAEYADAMQDICWSNLSYVSDNNHLARRTLQYKGLEMNEFEWFLLELPYGEKKETRAEYEVFVKIAGVLAPIHEGQLTVNYNFVADPSDIKGKVAEIERICGEYLTSIGK